MGLFSILLNDYFQNLREHIENLDEAGLLYRIKSRVCKDTELMPVVRWQYRGLVERDRKAFIFDSVVGTKGEKYEIPVGVSLIGASRDVYAKGMMCKPEEILEKWTQALLKPIEPQIVENGEIHDTVMIGEEIEKTGLLKFPIPISTPGYDPAPYITPCIITKDPETGIRNLGTYRCMLKGKKSLGIQIFPPQHISVHAAKCKKLGKTLEAAIIIGAVPCITMVSVARIPYGLDEFSVAGAIAREPIKLVKCKTIDLEVPVNGEIVIEGEVHVDQDEPEGPFGEFSGYIGPRHRVPFFEVKCITHRQNPIYQVLISQMPPSESSKIRGISWEASWYKFLKYDCNIPGILDVAFLESSGSHQYMVIQMKKIGQAHPWQALHAANSFVGSVGKYIVVVDDDINPRDPDMVNWALSFRTQPHRDIQIEKIKLPALDPSAAPLDKPINYHDYPPPCSAALIDATRKWDYPPVSLPTRDFMINAKEIWEKEGLPPLDPREPWFGYTLGYWYEENEKEAKMATNGEYLQTGEKLQRQRKKI
jgi:4-hydroxy-3-polyprenylbenzoate decarboxylase